eukprot:scaffold128724_cov48-Phaeocystis_antarctica.AAC.2
MCHASGGDDMGGDGNVCLLRLFFDCRRRLLRRKPQALPLRMVRRAGREGNQLYLFECATTTRPGGCWVPEAVVRASQYAQGESGS